jgi:hypothetical protein
VEIARGIAEIMKLADEIAKSIRSQITSAKDERTRSAYEDYQRDLREIAASIYGLIGKMRMDRVLDPEEIAGIEQIGTASLVMAQEPEE